MTVNVRVCLQSGHSMSRVLCRVPRPQALATEAAERRTPPDLVSRWSPQREDSPQKSLLLDGFLPSSASATVSHSKAALVSQNPPGLVHMLNQEDAAFCGAIFGSAVVPPLFRLWNPLLRHHASVLNTLNRGMEKRLTTLLRKMTVKDLVVFLSSWSVN